MLGDHAYFIACSNEISKNSQGTFCLIISSSLTPHSGLMLITQQNINPRIVCYITLWMIVICSEPCVASSHLSDFLLRMVNSCLCSYELHGCRSTISFSGIVQQRHMHQYSQRESEEQSSLISHPSRFLHPSTSHHTSHRRLARRGTLHGVMPSTFVKWNH